MSKKTTVYSIYIYIYYIVFFCIGTVYYVVSYSQEIHDIHDNIHQNNCFPCKLLIVFVHWHHFPTCVFFSSCAPNKQRSYSAIIAVHHPSIDFWMPKPRLIAKVPPARHDELVVNGLPLSGVGVIIDLRLRSAAPVFFCGSDSSQYPDAPCMVYLPTFG